MTHAAKRYAITVHRGPFRWSTQPMHEIVDPDTIPGQPLPNGDADCWQRLEGARRSLSGTAGTDDCQYVVDMLYAANVASVNYRYDDADELTNGPRWLGGLAADVLDLSPVAILKLIGCYEYQSCEPPTWYRSEAKQFIEALKDAAISALPGYAEASWG